MAKSSMGCAGKVFTPESLRHEEADKTIVAVIVDDSDQASLSGEKGDFLLQHTSGFLAVLWKTLLCEVELVGTVDELDRPVDMGNHVVLDMDLHVAAAQKFFVIAGSPRLVALTSLQEFIMGEAAEPAVILALEARIGQHLGNKRFVFYLEVRDCRGGFGAVVRVIVDKHYSRRPKLNYFYQFREPTAFRLP